MTTLSCIKTSEIRRKLKCWLSIREKILSLVSLCIIETGLGFLFKHEALTLNLLFPFYRTQRRPDYSIYPSVVLPIVACFSVPKFFVFYLRTRVTKEYRNLFKLEIVSQRILIYSLWIRRKQANFFIVYIEMIKIICFEMLKRLNYHSSVNHAFKILTRETKSVV